MSISPIMSAISPMVMSYAPSDTSKVEDTEHKQIMQSLQAIGITPSGNKETDKTLLNTIQAQLAQTLNFYGIAATGVAETDYVLLNMVMNAVERQQDSSNDSSSGYIPFEDVMNAINITPTGDIEEDYDDTITELEYRISTAADEEEEAYYESLKTEVEEQYTDYMYSQSRNDMFIGSCQLSSINRFMMI